MPALGGVPQQIGQAFSDIASEAAKGAVQAGKDIVGGTVETALGATPVVGASAPGQPQESTSTQNVDEKRAAEKRRYEQVLAELNQYRQRRQQLDAKIAQDKADQEAATRQEKDAKERREKESWTAKLLGRVGRESHGESMKTKE